MSKARSGTRAGERRRFTEQFKRDAVQMFVDGHSATSIAERLGLSTPNLLYSWKHKFLRQGGLTAESLDARVRELEAELSRVERERDILKKALTIFGRDG